MKKIIGSIVVASVLFFSTICNAQQYTPGVEGIDAGSYLPSNDGFTVKVDNAFYSTGNIQDMNIDDFDLFKYTAFVRGFYGINTEFFGAKWVPNVSVPVIYGDLDVNAFNAEDYTLGNIVDVVFSGGFYSPTSDEDNAVTYGQDYWTGIAKLGGTYYFGAVNPWTISGLASYEYNSDSESYDIEIGDTFTLEVGVGKYIEDSFRVGVVGYAQWQLDDNVGKDLSVWQLANNGEVYALGPQADFYITSWDITLSAKSLFEFGAEERSNGNMTVLSISKAF
jgi:hypothetical protein